MRFPAVARGGGKWTASYAAACAVAIPLWWLALFTSPAIRGLFVPPAAWPEFRAVLLPDLLLALACGILAVQSWRGKRAAGLTGLAMGGWVYATAYSIAWAGLVDAPWLGPAIMVAGLAGFAVVTHHELVPPRPPS